MARIQIFLTATPVVTNANLTVRAGFFADDYSLTDVTDNCTFLIDFGANCIKQSSNNVFLPTQAGDVGLKANYTDSTTSQEYTATLSFVVVNGIELLDVNDVYNLIKQEEPEGVYTQLADPESFTYLDNMGVATVFAELYSDLLNNFNDIFPELTTNYQSWINALFSEIYIDPTQGNINKLLQFLRNLQILSSMNPFDIANAINQYIYYRTNIALYVYIFEHKINFNQSWILGTNNHSILGVNTYISSSNKINTILQVYVFDTNNQLSNLFKIELESFINKIIRVFFGYEIDYSHTPSDFGLTYDIGMTYKGDQRNIYSYCLKYDETAFYGVVGLINPISPQYIQSMAITPSDSTDITEPTKFTVIGTFIGGFTSDITADVAVSKSNKNLLVLVDLLIPQAQGDCTLTITYGNLTNTIDYKVL